jgi:hypothetical protein
MYNHDAFPIVTNCRLAGNAAENQGGAIFNEDSSPIVTNCTLAGNAAEEQGGGIFNLGRSEPVFRNSIVFGNTGASFSEVANLDCFEDSCTSAPHTPNPTFENCNIGLSGGSSAWRMADATDLGGNIDADPMYADVEGDDFSLLLGSPCIDTGDDELLPEDIADLDGDGDTGERLPFDLTGSLRSTGAAPDMGAYEYQP